MPRKTITLSEADFNTLDDAKPDETSWGTFLVSLIDDTDDVTNADLMARLDDLEASIPTQTAGEIATQFR